MNTHRCPEPSCSFFNQVLPYNAKVCPMCGTSLGGLLPASTPDQRQPLASIPQASVPVAEPPNPVDPHPQLRLHHLSGSSFLLLNPSGVIGRQNKTSGTRPDIDLSSLPHAEIVSRRHAHLYWDTQQNMFMIVDNSRNGSYLNGQLLDPGTPHPVSHGDELQLGQEHLIRLQVELIRSGRS